MKNYLLSTFLSLLITVNVIAQEKTISGKIFDEKGESLSGVNIKIKGTSKGTITDFDGNYQLSVSENDVLIITFVGYEKKEVPVENTTTLDISLTGNAQQMKEVVVLGTRRTGRTVIESSAPIDVIKKEDIQATGFTQTIEIIQNLIPSFNAQKNSITDGTDYVRPATLRGLGPEHVLVLINGKRRHISSLVHVNDQNRGSVGVDLNAIPPSAIERIEVLRDGAAAQYGSDAIAGVINIILKKNTDAEVSVTYGMNYSNETRGYAPGEYLVAGQSDADFKDGYYLKDWSTTEETVTHTDGQSMILHLGKGFNIGKGGNIYVSGQLRKQGKSNRAGYDPRYNYFGEDAAGVLTNSGSSIDAGTANPKEASFDRINHWYGKSELDDYSFFMNFNMPIGSNSIYAFGGYNYKKGLGPCYYRRANDNRTVRSIYPDGFLPQINPIIQDFSLAAGIKGDMGDWTYDLSETVGISDFNFRVTNTANASLGSYGTVKQNGTELQKNLYDDGSLIFTQASTNFDLSRKVDLGMSSPLFLALGAEFRYERYQLTEGELGSYLNGNNTDYADQTSSNYLPEAIGVTGSSGGIQDGPNQGNDAPVGCQCFPGYSKRSASDNNRTNIAIYTDAEMDLSENFTLGLAGRFENYSDFGNTINGKISLRAKITEEFAWRGTASTGFRAPALAQQYYAAIATNAIADVLVESGTFPVNTEIAKALGASDLKAEKSINFSTGLTYSKNQFSLTVDAYYIILTDRVILSEDFSGKIDDDGNNLLANYLKSKGVYATSGRYFTNALNTATNGVDITGNYGFNLNKKSKMRFTLSANFTKTEITNQDDINTPDVLKSYSNTLLLGRINQTRLERSNPSSVINFIINYDINKFGVSFKTIYYGDVTVPSESDPIYDKTFSGKIINNIDLGYNIMKKSRISIGSNNLFDIYPEKNFKGDSFNGIFPYSGVVPYGFTGRYVYARLDFRF